MKAWWNKYLHVPFAEKGRTMEAADCWGLVRLIYAQERGIELPDYLDVYETTNDREALSKVIGEESRAHWETPQSPETFDVILLTMRGVPMHCGIVTKKNHMIHCARGIGTVHEHYGTARWKHKVHGFSRWKK